MKRSTIIALLFLLLMGACMYSESDYYFVEPIAGDPPIFSVTTNLDTIVDPSVFDSLEVIYDVEIENGELIQVEAYLQGSLLFSADTTHGSFWIDTADVQEPGVDTLGLWFYYNTNSNSLADILGVEYNVVNLKYGILFEGGGGL